MINTFNNVTVQIEQKIILTNVNFELPKGETIGLIGKNGAGKTTFISTLLGLIVPSAGNVTTLGVNARDLDDEQKQRLAFVPQHTVAYEHMKVGDALQLHQSCYDDWDQKFAERMLVEFTISEHGKVGRLSGGQKQIFMLVLALASRPDFLVMDEPFASLDPAARRKVLQYVIKSVKDDCTILYSTHIMSDLTRLATRLVLVENNSITLNKNMADLDFLYLFNSKDTKIIKEQEGITVLKEGRYGVIFSHHTAIDLDTPHLHKLSLEEFFVHWQKDLNKEPS